MNCLLGKQIHVSHHVASLVGRENWMVFKRCWLSTVAVLPAPPIRKWFIQSSWCLSSIPRRCTESPRSGRVKLHWCCDRLFRWIWNLCARGGDLRNCGGEKWLTFFLGVLRSMNHTFENLKFQSEGFTSRGDIATVLNACSGNLQLSLLHSGDVAISSASTFPLEVDFMVSHSSIAIIKSLGLFCLDFSRLLHPIFLSLITNADSNDDFLKSKFEAVSAAAAQPVLACLGFNGCFGRGFTQRTTDLSSNWGICGERRRSCLISFAWWRRMVERSLPSKSEAYGIMIWFFVQGKDLDFLQQVSSSGKGCENAVHNTGAPTRCLSRSWPNLDKEILRISSLGRWAY